MLMDVIAAFEDFLLNYKSTQTDLDLAATDAFQDLNIDGDSTSDEYDFMDDVAGGKEARRPNGQHQEPRRKYMDMLQKVADRSINEVTIELDDLDNVCPAFQLLPVNANGSECSTRRVLANNSDCDWSTPSNETQSTTSTSCRKPWTK